MKRGLCIIILTIIVASLSVLGGCFLLKSKPIEINITIHQNNEERSITAVVGNYVNLSVHVDEGEYCKGIFDKPTGGTKYFGGTGKSIDVWSEENPTEFYVQNGSIYDLVVNFPDDGSEISFGASSGYSGFTEEFDDCFISAVVHNPEAKIEINTIFSAKGSTSGFEAEFRIYNNKNIKFAELVDSKEFTLSQSYQQCLMQTVTEANVFRNGSICFLAFNNGIFGRGTAKYVSIDVRFIKDTQI